MPKKKTVRKWSHGRRRRVFLKNSTSATRALLATALPILKPKIENLSQREMRELETAIAEKIRKKIESEDYIKTAKSFPEDVDPETVDNLSKISAAISRGMKSGRSSDNGKAASQD